MDVNSDNTGIVLYANLLSDIKTRIRLAQVKATHSANAEMNQDIDSFLPQPVAKSGSSDFSHRPDAKSPSADLILSIPWGHHIFDFLTLTEPFNEREVKKLGAIYNKFLNSGTASTQKTEYRGGNTHWVSGADVNTHLIETYWQIGQYIVEYPISQMPSHQLSWSHYVELLKLDNDLERGFYEKQAIAERWSVAELKRQKASALFLRLAAGNDKEEILKFGQMNLYMGYFANEEELRRELEMICQTEEDNG